MKAIVYTEYGPADVLRLEEVAKPVPGDNEVLIRVHATTVTAADCMARKGIPRVGRLILGLRKPRNGILGIELAGKIESTGKDVDRFRAGDEVFGFAGFPMGTYAEYKCMAETASLVTKLPEQSYDEAAAVTDGASTALFFLKAMGKIQPGEKVLVIGASGSIGTFAVQLAKHFGADVTGVCSTANLELVRSLGADNVIDYTKTDFATRGETYDIIFDTVGKSSFSHCKAALTKNGRYLVTVGLINSVLMRWTSLVGGKQVIIGLSTGKTKALIFIKELIQAGKLNVVIDRRYPLEQTAEAHRYVEQGHKKGNVVITLGT